MRLFLMTKNSLLQKKMLLLSKVKMPKLDPNLEKFNCDQCNCTNLPEKGLTQHKRMKHCHSMDFQCSRQAHADLLCDVIALISKETLKGQGKGEEINKKCNTENVLKRHIISSHKNEMGYVQPHTTTHITKHKNFHIKIYTCKNPYICTFCGIGAISNSHIKSHMKSHDNKSMNHCALCRRKFISRNHLNIHIKRNTKKNLYNCYMWQRDYIQESQRDT